MGILLGGAAIRFLGGTQHVDDMALSVPRGQILLGTVCPYPTYTECPCVGSLAQEIMKTAVDDWTRDYISEGKLNLAIH